ncbi:MFS general substrate transporter [Gloeophyllum trabeum ATCC 11539]|uniref:MFS general substrate transporter n=1 Tax=Gloeophyllum trabeum (strain ATCC 11539 / FP-39264 / Madison 617) TaxID=670483 RepID=S7Q8B6_GLOTA|nr:MFS general substrate transporter [Gloeophyllum trabeum ATCC 11539]EPQ55772.1 MFS general substrate transporter [Gloeophyllum trabeum ATCC 11539]
MDAQPSPPLVLEKVEHEDGDATPREPSTTENDYEGQVEKTPRTEAAPPPDGGYGWVVVACGFWVCAMTWGVNAGYAIYLGYFLNNNIFPGATKLEYAFVGGLSISQALMIAPAATALSRQYGFRATMLLGVCLESGALIAASFANRIWHLFLTQGILFGWGLGLTFTSSIGIPSQWFLKRRSITNGIVSAGSGIGGIIWALATNSMIESISLAWAYRITAICLFVVNIVATLFMRDRNKHINPNQRAFDISLLLRGDFLLILAWACFSLLGYIVLLYSLSDFSISKGLSTHQASIVTAVLSVGMTVGRPLVGYFSDSVGRINMAGIATFITGLTCFIIWIPAQSYGVCVFFALVNGAICGSFWSCVGPLTAEVVGIANLPSGLSLVWLSVVVPCTFAEAIAFAMRRGTGPSSYIIIQVFTGIMFVVASVCLLLLRGLQIEKQRAITEGRRLSVTTMLRCMFRIQRV